MRNSQSCEGWQWWQHKTEKLHAAPTHRLGKSHEWNQAGQSMTFKDGEDERKSTSSFPHFELWVHYRPRITELDTWPGEIIDNPSLERHRPQRCTWLAETHSTTLVLKCGSCDPFLSESSEREYPNTRIRPSSCRQLRLQIWPIVWKRRFLTTGVGFTNKYLIKYSRSEVMGIFKEIQR